MTLHDKVLAAQALREKAGRGPFKVLNDNEDMDQSYSPLWIVQNEAFESEASDNGDEPAAVQWQLNCGYKDDADFIAASHAHVDLILELWPYARASLEMNIKYCDKCQCGHRTDVTCETMQRIIQEAKEMIASTRGTKP